MRRFLATLLAVAVLALSLPAPAVQAAEEPQFSDIGIQIEGRKLEVLVINLGGRTLVPLLAVGEVLGAVIGWDESNRTATLTLSDRTVSLQIGSTAATVMRGGQSQVVTLDVPAVLFQDRTYVPARFVAEGLGYKVSYDEAARVVTITGAASESGTTSATGPGPGPGAGSSYAPDPGPATETGGGAGWQAYDLTGDGRFDSADVEALWAGGPGHTARDLNGDGKKNTLDMWDMLLRLTQWDRNADRAITAADFETPAPIALPTPDAEAVDRLVMALLAQVDPVIPPGLQVQLGNEWAPLGAQTAAEKGVLWEETGVTALFLRNLETAQWAFAQSYLEAPERDSALANLGFVLAESGRYEEAMLLYARAREMNPDVCVTNSNIAWVFARHNQLDEAIAFYQKAVQHCPDTAQFRLNLGAVYLRAGRVAEAEAEFARAAELNPNDDEALIIAVASNPAPPQPAEAHGNEYMERQRRLVEIAVREGAIAPEDADDAIVPWEHLRAAEKWEEIRQSIADQQYAELQRQLDLLGQRTYELLREEADKALPQGVSACEDFHRWSENFVTTIESMDEIARAARARAYQMATATERKIAAIELSMDNLLLEMALPEAQEAMLRHSDDISARQAFEASLFENYYAPMDEAAQRMRGAVGQPNFEIPNEDTLREAVVLLGLMVPAVPDPAYNDMDRCGEPGAAPEGGWEIAEQEDNFAIGFAIVEIEYKFQSGEITLQVGQGLMVAGTWSPKNGFGVQFGTGFDLDWGPFSAGASTWIKYGSDGSISWEVSGGGKMSLGRKAWKSQIGTDFSVTATKTLRAATHEPIGALK